MSMGYDMQFMLSVSMSIFNMNFVNIPLVSRSTFTFGCS